MKFNYEQVKINPNFPAMLLIQNLTGENRHIPMHWHRSLEIDLITDGSLIAVVNGQETTINSGDLLLVNSGDLHELNPISSRIKSITLLISYDFIKSCLPNFDQMYFNIDQTDFPKADLINFMQKVGHIYQQHVPQYQLLIGSELYQIMYLLTTQAMLDRTKTFRELRVETHYHMNLRRK